MCGSCAAALDCAQTRTYTCMTGFHGISRTSMPFLGVDESICIQIHFGVAQSSQFKQSSNHHTCACCASSISCFLFNSLGPKSCMYACTLSHTPLTLPDAHSHHLLQLALRVWLSVPGPRSRPPALHVRQTRLRTTQSSAVDCGQAHNMSTSSTTAGAPISLLEISLQQRLRHERERIC
jgi:hypothetical protein